MNHPAPKDYAPDMVEAAQQVVNAWQNALDSRIYINGRPGPMPNPTERMSLALEAFAKGRVDAVLKKLTSPEVVEAARGEPGSPYQQPKTIIRGILAAAAAKLREP